MPFIWISTGNPNLPVLFLQYPSGLEVRFHLTRDLLEVDAVCSHAAAAHQEETEYEDEESDQI